MSNCWIFSAKFENWLKLREGKIWAAKRTLTKEKVKNGDDVAIYVIGTNSICGAYQINGDWYSSKEPYWPDEVREGKVMYPHQVKLEVIQEGVANIEKLASSLTFIGNKKNRFVYFRGTPANFKRPIPASDYQKILEEMKENPLPTNVTELLKRKEPIKSRKKKAIEWELPSFKLDDFNVVTEYIRNIDKIAKRNGSLKVDNFQNRFEDVVYSIFRIMQLDVEQRGYKRTGEEQPDGVITIERSLLIPYDCKSSEKPYDFTIYDRRSIDAHIKEIFKEFKSMDFKKIIILVISHSFDTSANRYADELGDKLEEDLGKPVKIALLTTKALLRLLGKVVTYGPKPQIFGRFKGIIDESQIEELWRTL